MMDLFLYLLIGLLLAALVINLLLVVTDTRIVIRAKRNGGQR
jgi:hypothetical protein